MFIQLISVSDARENQRPVKHLFFIKCDSKYPQKYFVNNTEMLINVPPEAFDGKSCDAQSCDMPQCATVQFADNTLTISITDAGNPEEFTFEDDEPIAEETTVFDTESGDFLSKDELIVAFVEHFVTSTNGNHFEDFDEMFTRFFENQNISPEDQNNLLHRLLSPHFDSEEVLRQFDDYTSFFHEKYSEAMETGFIPVPSNSIHDYVDEFIQDLPKSLAFFVRGQRDVFVAHFRKRLVPPAEFFVRCLSSCKKEVAERYDYACEFSKKIYGDVVFNDEEMLRVASTIINVERNNMQESFDNNELSTEQFAEKQEVIFRIGNLKKFAKTTFGEEIWKQVGFTIDDLGALTKPAARND